VFIRAMHNRVGAGVSSREMTLHDGFVLVPLVAVIIFMALYPQLALKRSEGSVKTALASSRQAAAPGATAASAKRVAGLSAAVAEGRVPVARAQGTLGR
jgi:NADH:ubiquinone oxidoreductase subunit 4 (subunit M)